MKKFVRILTLIVLCTVFVFGLQARQEYRISDGNRINFGQLLGDLQKTAYAPSAQDAGNIDFDLETIRAVSPQDYSVAKSIAEHWQKVYLDPDYRMNLYRKDTDAEELERSGIRNTASHAFVVLGYELHNGEMTEELKGRCDAAAAAAKRFPNTILVCSGGATGANNPERHTEAGMMKTYLVEVHGIDAARILTDEKAMTTAENAINTFEILKQRGVQTMTIVTSSYHQRWGQVLYHALAALYNQKYGYQPRIVSNYSYEVQPENEAFRNDARIAVQQLGRILELPNRAMNLPGRT